MPLSATATIVRRAPRRSSAQAAAVSMRKVSRSRLLTPRIRAPASSATVELVRGVDLDQRVEAGVARRSEQRREPRAAAAPAR